MVAEYMYIIAVMGMSYYHGNDPGHLNLYISGYMDTEISLDLPWIDDVQRIALTEGNNRQWAASYQFTADQEKRAIETGIRVTTSHPVSIQVSRGKMEYTNLVSYTAFSLKDYSKEFYLSSSPISPIGLRNAKPVYTIATGTEPATITLSRITPAGSIDTVESHTLPAHALKEVTVSNTYDNLTGIYVRSDFPIAVFSGHQCGNVPTDVRYCEPLFQQILPLAELGNEYIAGPIAERGNSGYTIRVIFTKPDTALSLTNTGYSLVDVGASSKCPDLPCGPLKPGDYLEFKMKDASTSSAIKCSKPCYVYQFNHGGADIGSIKTDPFMMSVQPLTQKESRLQFSTISTFRSGSEVTFLSFITLVTQAGSKMKLDDAEITNPEQLGDWDVYSKEIDQGFHTVSTVDNQLVTMVLQVYGHGPPGFSGQTAYGLPVAFPGVASGDSSDSGDTSTNGVTSSTASSTGVVTSHSNSTFTAITGEGNNQDNGADTDEDGISQGLMIALIVIAVLIVLVIVLVVTVIYIIRKRRATPNLSSSAALPESHQYDIPSKMSETSLPPPPYAALKIDDLPPNYKASNYYYSPKTGQVNSAITTEYDDIARPGADINESEGLYETPVAYAEDTYEEI